uniref:Uncharacterized protein n=1 Tax=Cacopsylla melanoneura TaxID=428564 RepID=A0A8D8U5I5_9HEMI
MVITSCQSYSSCYWPVIGALELVILTRTVQFIRIVVTIVVSITHIFHLDTFPIRAPKGVCLTLGAVHLVTIVRTFLSSITPENTRYTNPCLTFELILTTRTVWVARQLITSIKAA